MDNIDPSSTKTSHTELPHITLVETANTASGPVVLVGLGLHAKRIYIHFLKKRHSLPKLIIELESNAAATQSYLDTHNIAAELFLVPDSERDNTELSVVTRDALKKAVADYGIRKAIISTEPKSHLAYASFFLEQDIDVLIDKPISAPVGASSDREAAHRIYEDYQKLYQLAQKAPTAQCIVQSQRRYHAGYLKVRELVSSVIQQYGVPMTHLYVYHSDGLWSMPNEYGERENHPYKYGYGKLMHSGYHFVDLFCWLTELNNNLPLKKPNELELFHQICEPNDCLFQINQQDYARLFPANTLNPFFEKHNETDYQNFGEVDSYTQLQLRRDGKTVLTGALHLLQNGFSRRSWQALPQDTYKSNGRVRHEQITLHVGPLMSIQIHSYESHEVADPNRITPSTEVGGLDHFEILVFRNVAMIGGEPFERILVTQDSRDNADYIGHNEEARQKCLEDFMKSEKSKKPSESSIERHNATNWLLSQIHRASCQKRQGETPVITISLPEFSN
ncbi:MAG TPA: hypothetical protein VGE59_01175 [Patescibacteria group bacterium]